MHFLIYSFVRYSSMAFVDLSLKLLGPINQSLPITSNNSEIFHKTSREESLLLNLKHLEQFPSMQQYYTDN